ncbi:hypothetical protein HDU67_008291 [Dinochytrium kinnereticum]|nr:hypothetical protein HDU67_008291 [Dinochytrium kinnereticum]
MNDVLQPFPVPVDHSAEVRNLPYEFWFSQAEQQQPVGHGSGSQGLTALSGAQAVAKRGIWNGSMQTSLRSGENGYLPAPHFSSTQSGMMPAQVRVDWDLEDVCNRHVADSVIVNTCGGDAA